MQYSQMYIFYYLRVAAHVSTTVQVIPALYICVKCNGQAWIHKAVHMRFMYINILHQTNTLCVSLKTFYNGHTVFRNHLRYRRLPES